MDDQQLKNIFREARDLASEVEIPFLISVILIGIGLSLFLRWFYIKYGKSNTNRTLVADSFPLLIISITLIIYLIKSSLALSLGLVGALSIVRFRAAIKEPEELVYLLFAIAIGLGLGAKQITAVIIIYLITLCFLYLRQSIFKDENINQRIMISLNVISEDQNDNLINQWINIISKYCSDIQLYRTDYTDKSLSASFTVDIKDIEKIHNLNQDLIILNKNTEISIIDSNSEIIFS